jgi:hypothetical protein
LDERIVILQANFMSNETNQDDEQFVEFSLAPDAPHRKAPLTTPLGRLIEELSYENLLTIAISIIAVSTIYFVLATPADLGITDAAGKKAGKLSDALYFTIVTFTTLGYGDLLPQGFGRVVSAFVVLSGLILTALFVGKIASERQYAMLLLLQTSDHQRRLRSFEKELREARESMRIASTRNNQRLMASSTNETVSLLQAIFNYIVFHLNQSRLIDFGNESALSTFMTEIRFAQREFTVIFRNPNVDYVTSKRCLKIVQRLGDFEMLIEKFRLHRDRAKSPLGSTEGKSPGLRTAMRDCADQLVSWAESNMSPWLLARVLASVTPGPRALWPKHDFKRIATLLGVSNTLVQECIRILISQGKIP